MNKAMTRLLASLALATTLPALAMAQQPRTIVGTWKLPGQGCSRAQGAMTIKPMGLESEDVLCKFTSVKREGNRVTWQGACDGAEGGSRETVIATENAGRLTIRYIPGGNVLEGLTRCP